MDNEWLQATSLPYHENVEKRNDININEFWKGKTVFVTGHTGFKGSWLGLWLNKLGADVIGYALKPPTKPSMYEAINLDEHITSIIGDIREKDHLSNIIKEYRPEIVFHLAAQPIVRRSYEQPLDTLEINVIGTANLLDAISNSDSVKVVVNVTSDKCYENKEWVWGYREIDSMGGYDLYSCSKGCSELITSAYRRAFLNEKNICLASARAGNVLGGGDWAQDRIVSDIIRSLFSGLVPTIRNPFAVRPWQHVLEALNGYMLLAVKMYTEGQKYAEAWNFGPSDTHIITVSKLAEIITKEWGIEQSLSFDNSLTNQPHEATILKVDSSKARQLLGWSPKLNIEETLKWTVDWYMAYYNNSEMKAFTLKQIEDYEEKSKNS